MWVRTKNVCLIQRFEIITFLRGYSIFTIVIFHLLQALELQSPWNSLIQFGGTGVHLFFLLSGFGLFYSYLYRQPSAATFYRHKFNRIYIPYIGVVLITATIVIWWPVFEGSWYALGGHVLLYKMFDEDIIGSYGYQLWFMSTLFQFYLVFYFLVWLLKRVSIPVFMGINVLTSILWALVVWYLGMADLRVWNSFFLQYIWEFALGMSLAYLVNKGERFTRFNSWHYLVLGLLFCGLYGWMGLQGIGVGKLFNDYFALIGYSAIAVFLYKILPEVVVRGMIRIGGFSFALYLWHMLFVELVKQYIAGPIMPAHLPVVLVISLVVAYWYNRAFASIFGRLKI